MALPSSRSTRATPRPPRSPAAPPDAWSRLALPVTDGALRLVDVGDDDLRELARCPHLDAVTRLDARVSVGATAQALAQAHEAAVEHGHCTLITSLAVPFVGLEGETGATPVKPDFAIVTPRFADDPLGPGAAGPDELDEALQAADANDETMTAVADEAIGSWLVMGDAKDYERVRSRIDDGRMLKGFLQVALGAESAEAWSKRPADMRVHTYGALAVPRNSFLQPTAVMERLDDHRAEVRAEGREEPRGEDRDDDADDDAPAPPTSEATSVRPPERAISPPRRVASRRSASPAVSRFQSIGKAFAKASPTAGVIGRSSFSSCDR